MTREAAESFLFPASLMNENINGKVCWIWKEMKENTSRRVSGIGEIIEGFFFTEFQRKRLGKQMISVTAKNTTVWCGGGRGYGSRRNWTEHQCRPRGCREREFSIGGGDCTIGESVGIIFGDSVVRFVFFRRGSSFGLVNALFGEPLVGFVGGDGVAEQRVGGRVDLRQFAERLVAHKANLVRVLQSTKPNRIR